MNTTESNPGDGSPPAPPPSHPDYIAWVNRVRGLQARGRTILLEMYDEICRGRANETWRFGPWKSLEECIDHEFGVHPQRLAHLDEAVKRYGRDWLNTNSFEAAIPMLRLPIGSKVEKEVLQQVEELHAKRGRPPSAEAISRIVSTKIPAARPVRAQMSESERLRMLIRDLEAKLKDSQSQLARECRARKLAEDKIEKLEKKLAACREKTAGKRA